MIVLFKFGLPRAVDEVEVGLGRLLLHIFPHQVCPFTSQKHVVGPKLIELFRCTYCQR